MQSSNPTHVRLIIKNPMSDKFPYRHSLLPDRLSLLLEGGHLGPGHPDAAVDGAHSRAVRRINLEIAITVVKMAKI
jgi:hypothetical protein